MALRVLLADESSTIKKVIQLSLHDFGVEVKSVSNGLDVISVLENFQPDIVFVDVLLSKKTGYEVCTEIKNHPQHSRVPVVMMWSGFMSLDEPKTLVARPDARLEKPFDSEQIRSLLVQLVPKASSNPIKDYLAFPKMPDFKEDMEKIKQQMAQNHATATPQPTMPSMPTPNKWPLIPAQPDEESLAKMDEEWAQQPLKRSDSAQKKSEYNDFGIKDLSQAKIKITDEFEEISFNEPPPPAPQRPAPMHASPGFSGAGGLAPEPNAPAPLPPPYQPIPESVPTLISPEQMEVIIREEVKKMATEMCLRICQKLLPEIAERLVQQEIQRILLENPQK